MKLPAVSANPDIQIAPLTCAAVMWLAENLPEQNAERLGTACYARGSETRLRFDDWFVLSMAWVSCSRARLGSASAPQAEDGARESDQTRQRSQTQIRQMETHRDLVSAGRD